MLVGDDLNDFVSGSRVEPAARDALARRYDSRWGREWIILPNPTYGGWRQALLDYNTDIPRSEVLERIRGWLEPFD